MYLSIDFAHNSGHNLLQVNFSGANLHADSQVQVVQLCGRNPELHPWISAADFSETP